MTSASDTLSGAGSPAPATLPATAAENAYSQAAEQQEPQQEAGYGEAQRVSISDDPRLRLFAMGINLLVVIELFIAMYFASQTPDRLTPVFFTLFFSMLVPTIIAAVVGRRIFARRLAAKEAR